MVNRNALGDFLKARRDGLRPEDVGLASASRRRVPGLRRGEVAALAGISPDYYVRIEQGRNDPSPHVLDALANALRLDSAATEYLHGLARRTNRRDGGGQGRAMEGIAAFVDLLPLPAFVAGRYLDVLAANRFAQALSPSFTVGRNLLYQLLLDSADCRLHVDWDAATAGVVGGLRQVAGSQPNDPRLIAMVCELSAKSERFRMLWLRSHVGFRPAGSSHMRHPDVGELLLRRNRFDIPDSGGHHLQVYHAEPGSKSAERLAVLQRSVGTTVQGSGTSNVTGPEDESSEPGEGNRTNYR